jgi:hypothetical protein
LTDILDAMTPPDVNGQPSLPKRRGSKGLLPSTWLERTLNVAGTRTLISWDRLVLCELVGD